MPLPFVFIFTRFARTVISLFRNPDSRGLLGLTGLVIASGATFYHYVEGWEWLDSFYFTVITLTTIGYGDFTPKTDVGKLFTMVYVFILGLGILSGLYRHGGQSPERNPFIVPARNAAADSRRATRIKTLTPT